jgi:hypothetical protein
MMKAAVRLNAGLERLYERVIVVADRRRHPTIIPVRALRAGCRLTDPPGSP